MCRVEWAEPCDVYRDALRVARREHHCGECSAPILPGSKYEDVTMLYDGIWATAKTCADCVRDRGWLVDQCGGYIHGEVLEELVEHWEEREFGDEAPMVLGRLIVGMRRRNPKHRLGELASACASVASMLQSVHD